MVTKEALFGHAIWGTLDEVNGVIQNPVSEQTGELTGLVGCVLEFTEYVRTLKSIPPWRFTSTGALDEINSALQNIIAIWLPEEDPENLESYLVTYLDRAVTAINILPTPAADLTSVEAARRASDEYSSAVTNHISQLEAQAKSAATEWDTERADLQTQIESLTRELEGLEAQQQSAEARVTENLTRLDNAISNNSTTIGEYLSKWTVEHDEAIESMKATSDANIQELNDQAQKTLDAIEDYKKQSQGLVESVGKNTISTEYGQYAEKQNQAAFWWSVSTVFFLGIALVVAGWTLVHIQTQSGTELAFKALATLGIAGTAAWLGRTATEHRREARDAKRVQLDLNALEPVVSRLGDKAEELKIEIIKGTFQRPAANPHRYAKHPQETSDSAAKSSQK